MNGKRWMVVLALLLGLGLAGWGVYSVRAATAEPTWADGTAFDQPHLDQAGRAGRWCQAYLRDRRQAEALGVTVEQLRASRLEAAKARLEQAYSQGRLSQAEYEAQLAWLQVRAEYLDPEALLARALGLSVDEVREACTSGKTLRDLLQEQGLDARTFRQQMKEAAVTQVLQALQDGKLTQEQLVRLLLRQELRHRRGGASEGRGKHGPQGPRAPQPGPQTP